MAGGGKKKSPNTPHVPSFLSKNPNLSLSKIAASSTSRYRQSTDSVVTKPTSSNIEFQPVLGRARARGTSATPTPKRKPIPLPFPSNEDDEEEEEVEVVEVPDDDENEGVAVLTSSVSSMQLEEAFEVLPQGGASSSKRKAPVNKKGKEKEVIHKRSKTSTSHQPPIDTIIEAVDNLTQLLETLTHVDSDQEGEDIIRLMDSLDMMDKAEEAAKMVVLGSLE
ncbi:hypothetical protein L486_05162 [Kwoniella mangroviensis CBS 10435]|uniref:Uncharacterized protein n=1 Tax=Kwoniella mangroviensis CBS 10435 TaxID=1331196 RepID=A0A1B9IQ75_9TREE|nr:hypothetical protein L486_05162 [Kwoniella mangroviensis CBS 10435]